MIPSFAREARVDQCEVEEFAHAGTSVKGKAKSGRNVDKRMLVALVGFFGLVVEL
jgi:hypothetical protein